MKKVRYALEAIGLYILFALFKILPAETASNIGGAIGRLLGPKMAASRKAYRNLENAFPDMQAEDIEETISGMWDNLGRVIAEYSHLKNISKNNTRIEDKDYVMKLLDDDRPIIFISAHCANWELNTACMLTQLDRKCILTYREPNNPWVAKLLNKIRTFNGTLSAYAKSPESAKHIMRALAENKPLGMLIDQKHNQGTEALFFGMPAMTNTVHIKLGQKFNARMVFSCIERLNGANFNVKLTPEIPLFDDSGKPRDMMDIIADTHTILEDHIAKNPEQWLWIHRRWKNH